MAKSAAAAEAGRMPEDVKGELLRLIRAITDEGGDERKETYEKAIEALEALKDLRISRGKRGANANRDAKKPSPPSPPEQIPRHFICPISSEIMKDPVVLATGETYDRSFIDKWLSSGQRTCPRTQQVLSDLDLRPNNVLRLMISQWCTEHGVTLPPNDNPGGETGVTRTDRNRLDGLLRTIMNPTPVPDKKQALKELRQLTKLHSSHRAMLGENPGAIPRLLAVLSVHGLDGDHEVREDAVTLILNLSIHDSNKETIGEIPEVILFLIESLKAGTMESRSNAAAALFTLSALDSNKTKIGDMGAMMPLVELLGLGSSAAKRDAASAIFNLCMSHENRGRAVKEDLVPVLLHCIEVGSLVDESLAVLAMLASDPDAVEQVGQGGGVGTILRVISESSCERNRENAAVVLFSVCMTDRTKLKEVRDEEGDKGTISLLAKSGTPRARRKAAGILDRLRRTAHNTHYSC